MGKEGQRTIQNNSRAVSVGLLHNDIDSMM